MKGKMRNNILLMMTAFIWGSSFVAQSAGMDYIGPFTFNSVRCLMGAAVLLPVIKFLDRQKKTVGRIEKGKEIKENKKTRKKDRQSLLLGGCCCGVILGVASSLQ